MRLTKHSREHDFVSFQKKTMAHNNVSSLHILNGFDYDILLTKVNAGMTGTPLHVCQTKTTQQVG